MATRAGNSIQSPGSRRPLGAVQRAERLRGQAGVLSQNTPKLGLNARAGISSGGGARYCLQGHLLSPPHSGQRSCPGRLGSQGKALAGKKCWGEYGGHGRLPTNTPRRPPPFVPPDRPPETGGTVAFGVGPVRGARRRTALGPRGRRPPLRPPAEPRSLPAAGCTHQCRGEQSPGVGAEVRATSSSPAQPPSRRRSSRAASGSPRHHCPLATLGSLGARRLWAQLLLLLIGRSVCESRALIGQEEWDGRGHSRSFAALALVPTSPGASRTLKPAQIPSPPSGVGRASSCG